VIVNGKHKAWFYPSKGLNELFYQAGKLPSSNAKAATLQKPNPKPKTPSTTTANAQLRRSYVEVLKMAFGGNNRKR
jgi:hypothetical protein